MRSCFNFKECSVDKNLWADNGALAMSAVLRVV